jgi:hypothetical protein
MPRIQIRKATRGSRSCYWERKSLVLLVERGGSPLFFILFIRIYLYILQCFSYPAFERNGSLSIAFGRLCLGCSSLLSCSGYSCGLDATLTNSTIVYKALEMARYCMLGSSRQGHGIILDHVASTMRTGFLLHSCSGPEFRVEAKSDRAVLACTDNVQRPQLKLFLTGDLRLSLKPRVASG